MPGPIAPAVPSLLTDAIRYPESPRWHDGLLWFSDVHDYRVKTVDLSGAVRTVVAVPGRPAGLGFLPDGRLLIAGAVDRILWVWNGEYLSQYADLSGITRGLLNDMVVDDVGRAYVADTGFNLMSGDRPRPGQLLLVHPSSDNNPSDNNPSGNKPSGNKLRVGIAADDVMFPNGAAISADGRTYWLAETVAQRVSTFNVAADGGLTRTGVQAELPDWCDGLCADADGGVWVALLRQGEFWHLTADGTCDEIIDAGGRLAVACVLGGRDRKSLFLCSADTTMTDLARGLSCGLIHVRRVDVPGAGRP